MSMYEQLLGALRDLPESQPGIFVLGGQIDGNSDALPEALCVEDLGHLRLPLSTADTTRLRSIAVPLAKQEPRGRVRTRSNANVLKKQEISGAWEVSIAKVRSPSNHISAGLLRGLGLEESLLAFRLQNLLILGMGCKDVQLGYTTEVSRVHQATLVLQLPTEHGHEGGTMVISLDGRERKFAFTRKSHKKLYRLAFLSGCTCRMEEILDGTRVCLVFTVLRMEAEKGVMERFPHSGTRVSDVLRAWIEGLKREDSGLPQKLVILLSHKYSHGVGRHGGDPLVVELLTACASRLSLELHVCVLKKPEYYVGTSKWRAMAEPSYFPEIPVDVPTELVTDLPDDFEKRGAVLIWPKYLTTSVLGLRQTLELVVEMQKRIKWSLRVPEVSRESVHEKLREVLVGFENSPDSLTLANVYSLLQLSLDAGNLQDFARVIKLMRPRGIFEYGLIASGVKIHGWDACRSLVCDNLLPQDQAHEYAYLASALQKLDCHEAAVCVAEIALSMFVECPVEGWDLRTISRMVFSVLGDNPVQLHKFLQVIRTCSTLCLYEVISEVEVHWDGCKSPPAADLLSVFHELCKMATERPFPSEPPLDFKVCHVLDTLIRLEDEGLLEFMAERVMQEYESLLENMFDEHSPLWKHAGHRVIKQLAEEQIKRLSTPKPEFNWCQPGAKYDTNKNVEAFLRGPLEKMTWGFKCRGDAERFVSEFNRVVQDENGFSATIKSLGVLCTLEKTKADFTLRCQEWVQVRKENATKIAFLKLWLKEHSVFKKAKH